jgi:competence protein ComEC
MRSVLAALALLAVSCVGSAVQSNGAALNIYYIDTEGRPSTLFVGPAGESLLVDAGNAGEQDLSRITETLRTAGVSRIDHMWTTHFHGDKVTTQKNGAFTVTNTRNNFSKTYRPRK